MRRDGYWRAPVVVDNLIARKELPAVAAVFVEPGVSIAKLKGKAVMSNRQEEYNTLSGAYTSFLLEEIFPEVRKHVDITDDAAGRGIAGCSSGGIASFTVAWQRPDQFRRVISFSGSFANLRGGQVSPDLVRRERRKPIRVFQHVGTNDIVLEGLPSWFEENNLMSAAPVVERLRNSAFFSNAYSAAPDHESLSSYRHLKRFMTTDLSGRPWKTFHFRIPLRHW